jgi:hypothetical protein
MKMSYSRVFAATLIGFVAIADRAPAGIIATATYNGHTYHLLDTDGTKWWDAAEAEAVSLGGHLVTINDAAENNFVFSTFGSLAVGYAAANSLPNTGKISLWIGYSDALSEGNYTWVSGAPAGYTNWIGGEPAGSHVDEDYAGIAVNFFGPGGWHDIVGDTRFADLPFGVVEIESELAAVPAPGAFALLASGLTGTGLVRGVGIRLRRRIRS